MFDTRALHKLAPHVQWVSQAGGFCGLLRPVGCEVWMRRVREEYVFTCASHLQCVVVSYAIQYPKGDHSCQCDGHRWNAILRQPLVEAELNDRKADCQGPMLDFVA